MVLFTNSESNIKFKPHSHPDEVKIASILKNRKLKQNQNFKQVLHATPKIPEIYLKLNGLNISLSLR